MQDFTIVCLIFTHSAIVIRVYHSIPRKEKHSQVWKRLVEMRVYFCPFQTKAKTDRNVGISNGSLSAKWIKITTLIKTRDVRNAVWYVVLIIISWQWLCCISPSTVLLEKKFNKWGKAMVNDIDSARHHF